MYEKPFLEGVIRQKIASLQCSCALKRATENICNLFVHLIDLFISPLVLDVSSNPYSDCTSTTPAFMPQKLHSPSTPLQKEVSLD